jgi:hypothetical protein
VEIQKQIPPPRDRRSGRAGRNDSFRNAAKERFCGCRAPAVFQGCGFACWVPKVRFLNLGLRRSFCSYFKNSATS